MYTYIFNWVYLPNRLHGLIKNLAMWTKRDSKNNIQPQAPIINLTVTSSTTYTKTTKAVYPWADKLSQPGHVGIQVPLWWPLLERSKRGLELKPHQFPSIQFHNVRPICAISIQCSCCGSRDVRLSNKLFSSLLARKRLSEKWLFLMRSSWK